MYRMENIACDRFYGEKVIANLYQNVTKPILPLYHSRKLRKIDGPLLTWKTFKKQEDCLKFVSTHSGLLAFTFQDVSNGRAFLAADPLVFWYYYFQRKKDKHCYEIIREYYPCKLYFDLEFDYLRNENLDGGRMVDCFIALVCYALKIQYNITCDRSQILDLDSTSDVKFSRHLIFQTTEVFRDNYNAGSFVKQLCYEINTIIENNSSDVITLILLKNFNAVSLDNLKQLQVYNSRGAKVLFCDESVYSKNRHFRLYNSSKLNKNVPLIVSEQNRFYPRNADMDIGSYEECVFLFSLITYVPQMDDNSYLTFGLNNIGNKILPAIYRNHLYRSDQPSSPFKDIDDFIASIVRPGLIWRTAFFPHKNIITYDIINNRFCGNVGREHKSNNVKYVVNVSKLNYYQKCYDPDCSGYKSEERKLPLNLTFLLNDNAFTDEYDVHYWSLLDRLDDPCSSLFETRDKNDSSFPDYGLSDTELMSVSY